MSKQQFEDLTMSFNPTMVEVKNGSFAYYTGHHTEESVAGNNRGAILNEEIFWEESKQKAEAKRDTTFLALPVSKLAEALANNSATILHQGQAILLCSGTGNGTAVPLTEKQAAALENEATKIRQVAQEIGFF
jgi:hypothetical protein